MKMLKNLFWKLYYGLKRETLSKTDILKKHGRLNGIEIINVKLSTFEEKDLIGIPKSAK